MDVLLRRGSRGCSRNEASHKIWEHSVQLLVQGFYQWVGVSVSLFLSLMLALTLSLGGFTSHCSASKSVGTFVVVMVTDIKR